MRLVDPLFPGTDGEPGEGMIIVRSSTAGLPDRVYRSPYQLELVDFDVEDENDDGIFEPGEHLFIRRIHIKNTGRHFQEQNNPRLVITLIRRNALSGPENSNRSRRL